MNKLIVALIAGTFAAVAGAQAPAVKPDVKAKQDMVNSTTKAAAEDHSGAAMEKTHKATKKHKKHKTTAKAKQDMVKSTTETASNANTGATTADQAAKNTAMSKAQSPTRVAPPKMGTPAADSAMQKAAKP